MCRKLFLLTSFLLVLALVSTNVAFGTSIDINIADDNDDVEERLDRNNTLDMGSSDLELPYEDEGMGDPQVIGIRFTGIGIPKGAVITAASVQFQVDEDRGGTEPVNVVIEGELAADAAAFANVAFNVTDRARTTAQVLWSVPNWTNVGDRGPDQATSDLAAVIQEIVNQDGWVSGNALVLIISDDPANPSAGIRCVEAGPGDDSAMLHVEFISKVAMQPVPADGAVEVDVITLEWTAADTAVSHKVYLSTDATIDESDFLAEAQMALQFADLAPGTTYYWRVDEVEADGAVNEGDLWSFATLALEAHFPGPEDGAVNVAIDAQLSWTAGKNAIMHDVYFGTDEATVAAGDPSTFQGKLMDTSFDPGLLEPFMTYYWKVDEFAIIVTNAGPVWSFSTPKYIVIDDDETTLDYDNSAEPYVSEVSWDTPQDLTVGGLVDLTLRFHGKPASEGSVSLDEATGTYSITGSGADIWGNSDQFHFGYRELTGDAVMVARVADNGSGTNEWAKGGVMIRQSLDAGSTHRYMPITAGGGNGASFQGRPVADAGSVNVDSGEVVAPPYWVKLERVGNDFSGSISPDGVTWTQLGGAETIEMTDPVLIGLAVTSHQSGEKRTFTFDNVDIVGNISADDASTDIGIPGNEVEPLYVALEDSTGAVASVTHPYAAAVQIDAWRQWTIPLSKFSGVDPTDAAKLYVGVGDGEPGGFGSIRVDGIRVVMPDMTAAIASWEAAVAPAAPGFLATNVADDLYDIGAFSGDITYEFVVRSNPDEQEASMCLIGRRDFGDTQAGLKYEQWNNTGTYGATLFGVVDLDFGIATNPGVDTHLVFVSSEGASTTALYVNGVYQASVDRAITLSGLVGIGYGARGEDASGSFDDFDGDIFGVAIFDTALSDGEIAAHSDAFFAPLSDVTVPGDIVKGVPDDGDWPGAEVPDLAIDDNTGTKYLHFKGETETSGFQVTALDGPSIVTGMTFTTANDAPERDPISFELSGSNESIDGPYELIASGDIVDFAQAAAWPRFTMNATPILFYNDVGYDHYQVLFPAVRDAANANSMQIAEVKLLGVPAPAGPIVHYKLDDGEGVIAVDSANGLDGILMGDPQWSAGIIGGALDLDGVDDYVDCGTNATLNNLSNAMTVSAWVNIRSVTTTWMGIVMKGETAWRLGVNGDTTGIHWGFTGGDRGWQQANSVTELPLGEWHHIAATYDKSVGGIVYVDGVAETENPDPNGVAANEMPLLLGENPEALGRFYDGLLDDVRIYDRALSADEISQLAGNILANGGFENGVVEPWSTYGDVTTEVVQELVGAAVPEAPIEGSSCLHVMVAEAGANFWDAGLQHTGHVFEAGKQYTLSAFLKCSQGTLDINFKPEISVDPWSGFGDQAFTMTEEWTEFSITTPVFDEDVSPATITFHIAYAVADFWIDGVRFVEVQ